MGFFLELAKIWCQKKFFEKGNRVFINFAVTASLSPPAPHEYRIYSIKRRGAYLIFVLFGAGLQRERDLFEA